MKSIVIFGAGIAGLTAAHELAKWDIKIRPIKPGALVLVRGLARIGQKFHYRLQVIFSKNNSRQNPRITINQIRMVLPGPKAPE